MGMCETYQRQLKSAQADMSILKVSYFLFKPYFTYLGDRTIPKVLSKAQSQITFGGIPFVDI